MTASPVALHVGMAWFADQPGGLDRYFEALLAAQRTAGAPAVGLACGQERSRPDEHAAPLGPLPVKLRALREQGTRLAPACDLVDAHFALHAAPVLSSAAARRRPLVVHFQGPWHHEAALEGAGASGVRARRSVERWVYRQAAACVVLCSSFGEILVQDLGVDPSRVHVVRPGVDVDRFQPGDRAAARRRLGLDPDRPTVVAVRRLVRRTGIDLLLQALALVSRVEPDVQLVVAGDGAERADLEAQAAQLGIGRHVTFLGRVADEALPDVYRAGDLSVVPTRALEGFGLVTLESFACGTPVVVTDVDGLADAPRQLDASCVVPPDDLVALGARLRGALDGSQPLPSAAACRAFAEEHRWSGVARRHLDLYAEVLDRPVVAPVHEPAPAGVR
jgi:glycosyltransferase involved in cell wall biosynthesis